MAFTPILTNQDISYVRYKTNYRNSARENLAQGEPVYFVPSGYGLNDLGYNGPKYKYGYTYDNCPSPENQYNGNCTWWCWGRLNQTMGIYLPNYGDAVNWYDAYPGDKDRNANNIQPGDIIVCDDGGAGHVMFVEQVSGNTVYISQSAYSTRAVWQGKACLVTNFQKSEIVQGNAINMYKNLDSAYYETVVGVIHTGEEPGPTPEPEEPEITISPASYNVTMSASEDYVDFPFNITIAGIPDGESASGGNTYPGLYRVYNTGWSYTSYTGGDGNTYLRATKQQTLRYDRESDSAYSTTKHMYYNMTFSNGSIYSDTPMSINVEAKPHPGPTGEGILMLEWYGGKVQIL